MTELAHDGDASALEVLELIGGRLGLGIVNLVNMLNPEVVVVGGGVIAAGELLLEPARRVLAERALRPSRDQVRIVRAQFGAESGMVGAAALALAKESTRPPAGSMSTALDCRASCVVCATPIGNLADITLRVLGQLAQADVLACEDTRHTRVLLEHHGVKPASSLSYHEHNEARRTTELITRMRAGETVALLSRRRNAAHLRPGFPLVRASMPGRSPVRVLPGASAVLCALVLSGLPVDRFHFVGLSAAQGRRAASVS